MKEKTQENTDRPFFVLSCLCYHNFGTYFSNNTRQKCDITSKTRQKRVDQLPDGGVSFVLVLVFFCAARASALCEAGAPRAGALRARRRAPRALRTTRRPGRLFVVRKQKRHRHFHFPGNSRCAKRQHICRPNAARQREAPSSAAREASGVATSLENIRGRERERFA